LAVNASERAEAREPLDGLDARILDGVRELWESADPMPAELIDRIQFATDLTAIDIEVLRLTEAHRLAAARGDEHARLITFESQSLVLMVTIGADQDGTNRMDGWLAPAASRRVELRTTRGPRSTRSDPQGRFAFDAIPAGNAQLVIALDGARQVATPTIVL
jgi:hypothetical protein